MYTTSGTWINLYYIYCSTNTHTYRSSLLNKIQGETLHLLHFFCSLFSKKNRWNQIFQQKEIWCNRFCVGVNTTILTLGVFLVSRAEVVWEPQEIPCCVCTLDYFSVNASECWMLLKAEDWRLVVYECSTFISCNLGGNPLFWLI